MKHLTPRVTIVLLSSLYLLSSCSPIVHKGYKQLNGNQKEQALASFEKAISDSLQRPAAILGQYKIRGSDLFRGTYRELEAAFIEVENEKEHFKNLPEDRKAYYERKKDMRITEKSFESLAIRIQSKALERIREVDSLLLLDTFNVNVLPTYKRNQPLLGQVEDSLVWLNWHSRHYNTLRSIPFNHMPVLERQKYVIPRSYERRMWQAFLRDYPLYKYRDYVQDFPMDEYTDDCYMDDFLQVVESKDLNTLVNFLDTCKQTNTDEIISYAIRYPVNGYLQDQLDTASNAVKRRFQEVLTSGNWIEAGFSPSNSPAEVINSVKNLIKETAPSNRSYMVLVEGLHFLHQRELWDKELELLRFAKPYYEEEPLPCQRYIIKNKSQYWFNNIIQILLKGPENHMYSYLDGGMEKPALMHIHPVVSIDDSILYVASFEKGSRNSKLDISRTVKKANPKWEKPVVQRNVSSKNMDYPMGMTADQDYLLIRRDTFLFISAWDHTKNWWGKAQLILKPIPLIDLKWIGNATLSRNGKVIIFEGSSIPNPEINEADIDLFVMKYDDAAKNWAVPEPMGFTINTRNYQERFPYLHIDNQTLVFSSAGHFGFYGQDWLMSTRKDSTWKRWSIPKNIGMEYNTYLDDWYKPVSIPASGKKVYYSNNEKPMKIESIELPDYSKLPHYFVMKGQFPFELNRSLMKVHTVFPLDEGAIDSCKVLPKGRFNLLVPDLGQTESYVYLDNPEFYSTYERLDMVNLPDVSKVSKLPKVLAFKAIIGQELPLPLKYSTFSANSIELSGEFKQELRWVAHYFENNNQTLLIGGYTAEEGDRTEQEMLSLQRAEAVKAYLTTLGLEGDRIWTQGFADDYLKNKKVNSEGTVEAGRRVAVFLKKP